MSRRFHSQSRTAHPLDAARLEAIALAYVARYATSRAKLARHLERKIALRGWDGEEEPPVEAIVQRCAALGYVDDAAFAVGRAASLARRGYGERRVTEALRGAGIGEEDAAQARSAAHQDPLTSALAFARRRRIGPYSATDGDVDTRRRALAALLRAGHSLDIARKIAFAATGSSLTTDE